jgi:hypothetical protein
MNKVVDQFKKELRTLLLNFIKNLPLPPPQPCFAVFSFPGTNTALVLCLVLQYGYTENYVEPTRLCISVSLIWNEIAFPPPALTSKCYNHFIIITNYQLVFADK